MLSSVEDVVKAVKSLKADVICLNEVVKTQYALAI